MFGFLTSFDFFSETNVWHILPHREVDLDRMNRSVLLTKGTRDGAAGPPPNCRLPV